MQHSAHFFGHFMQLLLGNRQSRRGKPQTLTQAQTEDNQQQQQQQQHHSLHAQQIFTRFSQRLEKR